MGIGEAGEAGPDAVELVVVESKPELELVDVQNMEGDLAEEGAQKQDLVTFNHVRVSKICKVIISIILNGYYNIINLKTYRLIASHFISRKMMKIKRLKNRLETRKKF